MTAEVTIRDLALGEADLLAEFFETRWRPGHIFHRDRTVLRWLFHDNPYAAARGRLLTCKAALCRDELVGVLCYLPFAFNRYGRRQRGSGLSSWWVREDHRRGGLALRLMRGAILRDMGFDAAVVGMLTEMVRPIYTAMGWVTVWNMPRWLAPLDRRRMIALTEAESSEAASAARRKVASLPDVPAASAAAGDPGVEVVELAGPDELPAEAWDAFYWGTLAPGRMGPAREAVYLRWRYGQIPIFRYRLLLARRGADLAGLLVFRVEPIRDRPEQVVRVVDLAAEADAAGALLAAAVAKARQAGAVLADFFCTHRQYEPALRAAGFLDAAGPDRQEYWYPYLFRPLDFGVRRLNCAWWVRDMDLRAPAARCDFVLMKGDYEFDRPN